MKAQSIMSLGSIFIFLFSLMINTSQGQNSSLKIETRQEIKTVTYKATDFTIPQEMYIKGKGGEFYMQVWKKLPKASVHQTFKGETAKYNLTVTYLDAFLKEPSIDVLINDQNVGTILFHKPADGNKDLYTLSEKTLSGIDIQKWSKITFRLNNVPMKEGTERLHVQKFTFTPTGEYEGEISNLENPEPLRFFNTSEEQSKAREMMPKFVKESLKPVYEERTEALKQLKTAEDWKKRQNEIRARFEEYFGKFPEKTPLKPRIIDVIDKEKYSIEKLIFESQPEYYCSANFYAPKNRSFPVPGILVTVGHKEDGKSKLMYHELCLGLVLKGYAVLIVDPMGQGERSEYFDAETNTHFLERKVDQHHYFGRQAFLADWSLPTLRTWDCIRAVDYLVSRTEVDTSKLAVVGNSGGGQMSLYTAAIDQRIKVCIAAAPGGSCESLLLNGPALSVLDIYSLVPPRPFRIVVGREAREADALMPLIEAFKPIYKAYNAPEDIMDMSIVDGLHDIKLPKRVVIYEWFNKWFDKENEGSDEAPLQPEKMESLWSSEEGIMLKTFGGETGQTLSAKRADQIYNPEKDLVKLKERVAKRIGLRDFNKHYKITARPLDFFSNEKIEVEKIIIESEKGIDIPTLLMKPKTGESNKTLILHVSDQGKPIEISKPSIPIELVSSGFEVLSIDVRGIGETNPSPSIPLTKYSGSPELQFRRDALALNSLSFKRTMIGMRTLDVLKVIDYIKSRNGLKDKSIVVIGEGLGGLWTLLSASFNPNVDAVVCVGTLPSYKLLVNSQYYNIWNYFWVPGALRDFDIPDLSRLIAPCRQLWINPVNALAEPLEEKEMSQILTNHEDYKFTKLTDSSPKNLVNEIIKLIQ